MKLVLKIEANGYCADLGKNCSTCFITEVGAKNLRLVLGKALYSVEVQGYMFNTSDVYNKAIESYSTTTIKHIFQKVYSDSNVSVSIKLA